MKTFITMTMAAAAIAVGAPAVAQGNSMGKGEVNASAKSNMNAEAGAKAQAQAKAEMKVVEKDNRGRAMRVEVAGQSYAVCTPQQQDSCINPREAGLKWGNRPLDYWPGKPASEIDNDPTR